MEGDLNTFMYKYSNLQGTRDIEGKVQRESKKQEVLVKEKNRWKFEEHNSTFIYKYSYL